MYELQLDQPLLCQDEVKFQEVWTRVMHGNPNPISIGRPKENPPQNQTQKEKILCFGDTSAKILLQESLQNNSIALEDYEKLTRQLPQKLRPQIQEIEKQRKIQQNQVETAYFLLTGIDYLQSAPNSLSYTHPQPIPADKRLRQRFREAQIWQGLYQKAAFSTQDSCLTTLFLQLEQAMKEETTLIHHLVESLFWMKHR